VAVDRSPEIRADTDAANEQFTRLMDRLGMTCVGRMEKFGLDTLCYALKVKDWGNGGR